jgi:hypothetical protein
MLDVSVNDDAHQVSSSVRAAATSAATSPSLVAAFCSTMRASNCSNRAYPRWGGIRCSKYGKPANLDNPRSFLTRGSKKYLYDINLTKCREHVTLASVHHLFFSAKML